MGEHSIFPTAVEKSPGMAAAAGTSGTVATILLLMQLGVIGGSAPAVGAAPKGFEDAIRQIDKLYDWSSRVTVEINKNTEAIDENTDAVRELHGEFKALTRALELRGELPNSEISRLGWRMDLPQDPLRPDS